MMMNLFSMFDPSTSKGSMLWYITFIPIIIIMMTLSHKNFKTMKMLTLALTTIKKEMKDLMPSKQKKMSIEITSSTFMALLILNMIALIPFNFTTTAHASFSLTLSMSLWSSVMIWGWINSFKMMMAHMTPTGTPNQLMNFMVLIELISNLIRPITLSVRLCANMVAGHLLMELLANFSIMSTNNMMWSSIPMTILIMLEMAVAIIQAYVLTTLITLYHNETF